MRHVLFIDPCARDRYELERVRPTEKTHYIYHSIPDYTSSLDISRIYRPIFHEIDIILRATKNMPIDGVLAGNDYPSQAVAHIIAHEKGLPGPDPDASLPLQDKYYMRNLQHQVLPETTPVYETFSVDTPYLTHVSFPCIAKPTKGAGSLGTMYVRNQHELEQLSHIPELYMQPLHDMLSAYSEHHMHEYTLLAENYAPGEQITVDGFIQNGIITIMGIVDCHVNPYTMQFDRFVYPSRLPYHIQKRMHNIVTTLVTASRLDNTLFNVELRYDTKTDRITIIEINPRMSAQFADMYESVDGYNPYAVATDIACGTRVNAPYRAGKHTTSVHFCMYASADYFVKQVPTPDEKQEIIRGFPDTRINVRVKPGKRISACHASVFTYGYMIIRVSGNHEAELENQRDNICSRLHFTFSD